MEFLTKLRCSCLVQPFLCETVAQRENVSIGDSSTKIFLQAQNYMSGKDLSGH